MKKRDVRPFPAVGAAGIVGAMSDFRGGDPASTPSLEVKVFRDGSLLLVEWCDSEEDADDAVARWSELRGVRCVVEDLATTVGVEDSLLDTGTTPDDSAFYPHATPA